MPGWDDEQAAFDDDFVKGATFHEQDHESRQRAAEQNRKEIERAQKRARRQQRREQGGKRVPPAMVILPIVLACAVSFVLYGPRSDDTGNGAIDAVTGASATTVGRAAGSGSPSGTTAGTTPFVDARSYDFGECLRTDPGTDANGNLVNVTVACAEPHDWQASRPIEMDDELNPFPNGVIDPAHAASPEGMAIMAWVEDRCRPHNEELLDGPLDPDGRYVYSGPSPSPQSWAAGDRTVWCGLGVRNESAGERGNTIRTSEPLDVANQHVVYPTGTCLTAIGTVPCAQPHELEVLGYAQLSAATAPPAEAEKDAWSALVAPTCGPLSRQYVGVGTDAAVVAQGFSWAYRTVSPGSWAAGNHQSVCLLRRADGTDIPGRA